MWIDVFVMFILQENCLHSPIEFHTKKTLHLHLSYSIPAKPLHNNDIVSVHFIMTDIPCTPGWIKTIGRLVWYIHSIKTNLQEITVFPEYSSVEDVLWLVFLSTFSIELTEKDQHGVFRPKAQTAINMKCHFICLHSQKLNFRMYWEF